MSVQGEVLSQNVHECVGCVYLHGVCEAFDKDAILELTSV